MEKKEITEIVNKLSYALECKDLKEVEELNETIKNKHIEDFVAAQLSDAEYGLYKFLVSPNKWKNSEKENKVSENRPEKDEDEEANKDYYNIKGER